ncbi:multidrug efflux pump subunit AcrA (membrane-fusion protein) [Pseudonocardia eucalypti]|nr:multidrug efflux pump subunit AcrA (membrane-fusion protein) [Pseudonocardia eucalypti]
MTLTSSVREGQVSNMVTAKGAVSAAKSANLTFNRGGNVKSIDVKVGDKVKKGQKVAELGNGGAKRAVLQAQQTLAQQQAALDIILNDVNPDGLRKIYEYNKKSVDQARKNIDLKEEADRDIIERQERGLRQDRDAVQKAKDARDAIPGCHKGSPLADTIPGCSAALKAVADAENKYYADKTTYINAINSLKVNRGVLRSTYRAARTSAVTAYNTWNIAKTNRPNQILAARAQVANAQVAVANALGSLGDGFVYAPADGVVSAVNGAVGEFSPPSSGDSSVTPNSPGSQGRIPNVGDLASADQKALTGGQSPNAGLQAVLPAGSTLIQISGIDTFTVVAAFPEKDAVRITSGAQAKVTYEALAGKETDGTVASIAPVGSPGVNAAPVYYATILLKDAPKELKAGLTANVSVVTNTVENKAMVVPTSSVTEDDGKTFVHVPGADGKPVMKEFTRGKAGDDNTQVLSGLNKDEKVFVPDSGTLPLPASDDVPDVPAEQPLTVDSKDPEQKAAERAKLAVPAAVPAAAPPAALPMPEGNTFPGDPGELPAEPGDMGSAVPGDPNAGTAGTNPFAPMNNGASNGSITGPSN